MRGTHAKTEVVSPDKTLAGRVHVAASTGARLACVTIAARTRESRCRRQFSVDTIHINTRTNTHKHPYIYNISAGMPCVAATATNNSELITSPSEK